MNNFWGFWKTQKNHKNTKSCQNRKAQKNTQRKPVGTDPADTLEYLPPEIIMGTPNWFPVLGPEGLFLRKHQEHLVAQHIKLLVEEFPQKRWKSSPSGKNSSPAGKYTCLGAAEGICKFASPLPTNHHPNQLLGTERMTVNRSRSLPDKRY